MFKFTVESYLMIEMGEICLLRFDALDKSYGFLHGHMREVLSRVAQGIYHKHLQST